MSEIPTPAPLEALFRDAMSQFASGVTLVTTRGADGKPYGFTASSFASLSLNPPLILVCMGNRATAYPVFLKATHFAISVLNEGQRPLATLFSTRGSDRFADPAIVDSPLGMPVASGALAQLDCALQTLHHEGDHAILIGRPLTIALSGGRPLIHYERTFRGLD
jgi:flavin reductase ActVB